MGFIFKDVPKEIKNGIEQLGDFLKCQKEISVIAIKSTDNKITFDGNKCNIEYKDKVYFFRALSILCQNEKENFSVLENKRIEKTAVMLDMSRNAVLTVNSLKKYMDYMALMGYNSLYLYIEDIFELEQRPHFGYLRGRYTKEELKQIDDYGFNYGIEVVPSIQALGHHYQYLKCEEASDIKDTAGELLVGEEKTYEFIESMLNTVLNSLRTRRVVINMDETHTLGLGNYLKKTDMKIHRLYSLNILNEYMKLPIN